MSTCFKEECVLLLQAIPVNMCLLATRSFVSIAIIIQSVCVLASPDKSTTTMSCILIHQNYYTHITALHLSIIKSVKHLQSFTCEFFIRFSGICALWKCSHTHTHAHSCSLCTNEQGLYLYTTRLLTLEMFRETHNCFERQMVSQSNYPHHQIESIVPTVTVIILALIHSHQLHSTAHHISYTSQEHHSTYCGTRDSRNKNREEWNMERKGEKCNHENM